MAISLRPARARWTRSTILASLIRGITMRIQRYSIIFGLLGGLLWAAAPAWGVNRDLIQLQTQVQTLQDQMTHMQQSLDERIAKMSKQLEDMQAAQQTLAAPQAGATPQTAPPVQAPPPDVLYQNAMIDYNAGKTDLATQEFAQFVKSYPDNDLAGNSYFYLAETAYRQGNYQEATKNYDLALQNFPSGNKAASAQLKKGFSLIELGQKENGIAELQHVIKRYPRSNEALQARDRLHKLGVSPTGPPAKRPS